jgi:hypothetical protein
MKLEAYIVGYGIGMAQVQSHLDSLRIKLPEIMKEKEKCEHVWCITCNIEGHEKEECPTFT